MDVAVHWSEVALCQEHYRLHMGVMSQIVQNQQRTILTVQIVERKYCEVNDDGEDEHRPAHPLVPTHTDNQVHGQQKKQEPRLLVGRCAKEDHDQNTLVEQLF